MDTSTSVRARLPATTRVARLFLKRLRGRLTLVAVLLVAVVIGAALALSVVARLWAALSGAKARTMPTFGPT